MLVLTRKPNEQIIIGQNQDIKITIVSVQGNKVRVAVEAPTSVPIHRKEILDTINQQALMERNAKSE